MEIIRKTLGGMGENRGAVGGPRCWSVWRGRVENCQLLGGVPPGPTDWLGFKRVLAPRFHVVLRLTRLISR